ncbi:hypothetical protein [Lacrimispora sp.]|uniref:hypothetical protein n=1 Tax=Lacrimispora sp. TaxID=2719234 RepID=UPI003993B2DF
MKIIKQDGSVVTGYSIEMQGCTIYCTPDNKPNERVECGKYGDVLRTTEVFSKMTIAGWNFKNPEYVMPQN